MSDLSQLRQQWVDLLRAHARGNTRPAIFSGDTLFNAGAGNCHNGGDPNLLFTTFAEQIATRMGVSIENDQLLGQREQALVLVQLRSIECGDMGTRKLAKENVVLLVAAIDTTVEQTLTPRLEILARHVFPRSGPKRGVAYRRRR